MAKKKKRESSWVKYFALSLTKSLSAFLGVYKSNVIMFIKINRRIHTYIFVLILLICYTVAFFVARYCIDKLRNNFYCLQWHFIVIQQYVFIYMCSHLKTALVSVTSLNLLITKMMDLLKEEPCSFASLHPDLKEVMVELRWKIWIFIFMKINPACFGSITRVLLWLFVLNFYPEFIVI